MLTEFKRRCSIAMNDIIKLYEISALAENTRIMALIALNDVGCFTSLDFFNMKQKDVLRTLSQLHRLSSTIVTLQVKLREND